MKRIFLFVLGALALWPILFVATGLFIPDAIDAVYPYGFIAFAAAAVLWLAMIVHAALHRRSDRFEWIVALVILGGLVMPVYWYRRLWAPGTFVVPEGLAPSLLLVAGIVCHGCGNDTRASLPTYELKPAGLEATVRAPSNSTIAKRQGIWPGVEITTPDRMKIELLPVDQLANTAEQRRSETKPPKCRGREVDPNGGYRDMPARQLFWQRDASGWILGCKLKVEGRWCSSVYAYRVDADALCNTATGAGECLTEAQAKHARAICKSLRSS